MTAFTTAFVSSLVSERTATPPRTHASFRALHIIAHATINPEATETELVQPVWLRIPSFPQAAFRLTWPDETSWCVRRHTGKVTPRRYRSHPTDRRGMRGTEQLHSVKGCDPRPWLHS